ncbi:MAG TPA: tRNA (guanosine(37)-N1)-methyltransferase TrmD [Eubacteriaceae bacterium]|jgi:tRNA (guanine37-N1)-methyltransferase|nr:tRNA (guanosine(37)-N1)-methyltransferase TrmD [Eubacteriaceae bacterium]
MRFIILTIFPEFFTSFLESSIIKKALERDLIKATVLNIREFSLNKHQKTDDYPFGGGPGMVMTPQPIADAIKHAKSLSPDAKVIYFTPKGVRYEQHLARRLSENRDDLILICGHYEGVDQRVLDKYVDMEISIGDFITTGGEIPAMILIDSVSRLLEGVLGNEESSVDESFSKHLLEFPQYTRPRVFEDMEVPEVLTSGNHKEIAKWRLKMSEQETKDKRPDLYDIYKKEDK